MTGGLEPAEPFLEGYEPVTTYYRTCLLRSRAIVCIFRPIEEKIAIMQASILLMSCIQAYLGTFLSSPCITSDIFICECMMIVLESINDLLVGCMIGGRGQAYNVWLTMYNADHHECDTTNECACRCACACMLQARWREVNKLHVYMYILTDSAWRTCGLTRSRATCSYGMGYMYLWAQCNYGLHVD